MVTIRPIPRALVPTDSDAAARISAPNYDEFQGDREIWSVIRAAPDSVLRITMAHCDTPDADAILAGDSEPVLAHARTNFEALASSPLTAVRPRILFIYEIVDPARPDIRQIGLGGMARTSEILTADTPRGSIIRNEGVREPKALGRAKLISATNAIIGTVNNAVEDKDGKLAAALEAHADRRDPDYQVAGSRETEHRIWLVEEPGEIARLQQLLSDEPEAYVADGNHRSAAAAMLGHETFLAVFFTADRMGIDPYNRLVRLPDGLDDTALSESIERWFHEDEPASVPYQPRETHRAGIYSTSRGWRSLVPKEGAFDPTDAAASIDHDIVQRTLFADLGILDAGDERLTFVGANKDAAWLGEEVDRGRAQLAVTLPAVTMEQFIDVCRQRRMMPPKSTWFEPKIRSGLVMALLGDG